MASPSAEYTTGCFHTWGCLFEKSWAMIVKVSKMAKKLAQDDPRRVIHSFKVGLALLLISIFYYLRPTFHGFGDNTMWAVITVVVVMEFSVGATLGKGLNRMLATLLAAALGFSTNCIATLTGDKGQAVLIPFFAFVTAAAVTFMRFFPKLKARYDYGLIIFILTFCVISVSGYRENEVLAVAYERILTIIIGSFIAIMVCICICPVWIGEDLHNLIAANMEKLADFFEGFGDEYFNNSENTEAVDGKPFLQGYKSVLSSKSNEETMANLARWEPFHGKFRFRHPWKQYLKVGNLTRLCAYKVEALNVYLQSEQPPSELRSKIQESCTNISSEFGKALRELSRAVRKMTKPSMPETQVANAKNAAESLKSILRTNPWEGADLLEIIPAATVASLLIEVVLCIENICQAVDELASLARFKSLQATESSPSQMIHQGTVQPVSGRDGCDHVITIAT